MASDVNDKIKTITEEVKARQSAGQDPASRVVQELPTSDQLKDIVDSSAKPRLESTHENNPFVIEETQSVADKPIVTAPFPSMNQLKTNPPAAIAFTGLPDAPIQDTHFEAYPADTMSCKPPKPKTAWGYFLEKMKAE